MFEYGTSDLIEILRVELEPPPLYERNERRDGVLLETESREAFRDDLGCSEIEWMRGKAWAFEQAMGLVWYYAESNPVMSQMGRRTLKRIMAAEG